MKLRHQQKIILLLFVLLLGCLRVAGAPAAARFSIVVLADTQKYSRYYPEMFHIQTQWIVDNAHSDDMVFTVHLGDVVDRAAEIYEWENADDALQRLDTALLPYSVLAGNHDLLNSRQNDVVRDGSQEPFLRYFPAERLQNTPIYGGRSPSGFNTYFVFEAAGQKFLVLALDWSLGEDSIQWVQAVLDAHPKLPTILTTHRLIHMGANQTPELDRNGKMLWERLIASNNQIFLAMNGHYPGASYMTLKNHAGNDVLLMQVDYQNDCRGGNGMLRLLTFDLQQETIHADSFSPYVIAKPPDQRTPCDRERKIDPANQFTIKLDMLGRFDNP